MFISSREQNNFLNGKKTPLITNLLKTLTTVSHMELHLGAQNDMEGDVYIYHLINDMALNDIK